MIKKIILTIIVFTVVISCVKKSDPEYKESKNIFINKNII